MCGWDTAWRSLSAIRAKMGKRVFYQMMTLTNKPCYVKCRLLKICNILKMCVSVATFCGDSTTAASLRIARDEFQNSC